MGLSLLQATHGQSPTHSLSFTQRSQGPLLDNFRIDTCKRVEMVSAQPALSSKIACEIELKTARRISIKRFLRQHALALTVGCLAIRQLHPQSVSIGHLTEHTQTEHGRARAARSADVTKWSLHPGGCACVRQLHPQSTRQRRQPAPLHALWPRNIDIIIITWMRNVATYNHVLEAEYACVRALGEPVRA